MNFQFYIEKLNDSEVFVNFKKENQDAYLCSGFFAIDKKGNDNKQQLDFFIPSLNKMFSFKLDQNPVEMISVESFGDNFVPKKLMDNSDLDFDEFQKVVEERMAEDNINKKIEKMLFSVQNNDGKSVSVVTIFISGLGLISVVYDMDNKEITKFEKKSFFDFIRVMKKDKD